MIHGVGSSLSSVFVIRNSQGDELHATLDSRLAEQAFVPYRMPLHSACHCYYGDVAPKPADVVDGILHRGPVVND